MNELKLTKNIVRIIKEILRFTEINKSGRLYIVRNRLVPELRKLNVA